MAEDLATISNLAGIQTQLDSFKKDINSGMEEVASGIFKIASAVADAEALLKTTFASSGDKILKEQRDKFFEDTALASSPSDKSKLLKIAAQFPLLKQYKDHIPQNFTAFYMIASSETIAANIKGLVDSKDEKRKLVPTLSIKQLKNLLEGRNIDESAATPASMPKIFDIKFTNPEDYKTLKMKELLHSHREGITKVVHDALYTYLKGVNSRISEGDLTLEYSPTIENYQPKSAS